MKYYKVKSCYDNIPIYKTDIGYSTSDRVLIGNELYTPAERKRYRIPLKCVDEVEINMRKTYTFFGARFEL